MRCAAELSKIHAMERKQKNDFVPIRTRKNPAAPKPTPAWKIVFLVLDVLRTCQLLRSTPKAIVPHVYCATHGTATHLPAGIDGVKTHA